MGARAPTTLDWIWTMTDNQLLALAGLRDGTWKFGKSIHGRYSLTSLHKRKFVDQDFGRDEWGRPLMRWRITPEGLGVLQGRMPHLFEVVRP